MATIMTAPLTPAEVEQFAKLSAELDGGDITFYPTADDVAIVKRVLRALTAAPIEKCIYCDLPSSKCLCAPDPRKRITAIPSKPYWLIERGQADGHTPTLWLREANAWKSGEPYLGMWTESAIEATRFETSSGAEYHIYKHSLHLCHVTEHLDLDAALTAAPIDGAAIHKDGGKTIFQPGIYPAAELEDAISRAVTDPAHETFIGGHAENPGGIGFVMRESAAPTVASGDGLGEYDARVAPRQDQVSQAMEHVQSLIEFAYEQGFHELGYDPMTIFQAYVIHSRRDLDAARDLAERLKMEAQAHAQEARTANATIAGIYRACTGSAGEPGNWHGAQPVIDALASLRAQLASAEGDAKDARGKLLRYGRHAANCERPMRADCTCGWNDLRAALAADKPQEGAQ